MFLVVVAAIILLLKIAGVAPVANWSWWWIALPWVIVFVWWEVLAPMIGWNKSQAEKRMLEAEKSAQEIKKKNRGF